MFEKLKEEMGRHAQEDYPLEACGIITKDLKYIRCRNISSYPKESFILDPKAVLQHEDNMLGIFHSHPGQEDPIPSKEDTYSVRGSDYVFIVGFGKKFYTYWYDNAFRFEELNENHLS